MALTIDFHSCFQPKEIAPGWWKLAGFDIVERGPYWVLEQTGGKYRSREGAYTDVRVMYYSVFLMVKKIEAERRKSNGT